MEISRRKAREQILNQIKYIKTCVLARELCLLIRTNRAVLEREDIHRWCNFIAKLCMEAGCAEPSDLCAKAAEAVLKSEEKYLELCEQNCRKCGEQRQPRRQPPQRTLYVA